MLWTGSKEQFKNFIQEINSCHPTIKFDYEINHKGENLFDTMVFINFDRKLKTMLDRKQSDGQNYLHAKYEHSTNLKNSIPYSQALRIRKICQEKQDFIINCKTLMDTFQESVSN